ncbi:MAG: hypothetical protein ACREFT_05855 [Acetobacteraceae bacterium]
MIEIDGEHRESSCLGSGAEGAGDGSFQTSAVEQARERIAHRQLLRGRDRAPALGDIVDHSQEELPESESARTMDAP